MMKSRFVINPCSGRNRRRPKLASAIRDFARMHGLEADVVLTEGPRHATQLAYEAASKGCELVVSVGGDGTMNEVAQALVGTPAALALIPCGSGNGLALHLGLPRSLNAALELIRHGGRYVPIDTGVVNDRAFFNAMGFGFDAEVSRRFNGLARRGLPAYLRTGLSAIRHREAQRCSIVAGDRTEDIHALLVAIANSDQYGNNARIAPGACIDDGLFDLVAIAPLDLLRLTTLVPRLFLGNLRGSPHVRFIRAASFVITRESAGLVHTDGETHMMDPVLKVGLKPRSLRVLVPLTSSVGAEAEEARLMNLALQLP